MLKDLSHRLVRLLLPAALSCLAAACSTHRSVNHHLEEVAKDWCRTIRASQVLPIYPLTEDIQPGDVFLVHMPIQDQQEQYERQGYLPLDYHLVRLPEPSYLPFYGEDRYDMSRTVHPPAHWQFPASAASNGTSWVKAPRAAFPTYSFSVSRSGGLNVGIPVSGVPLGLNLLGSGSATGTVTIADAYTYGVDVHVLRPALTRWAGDPEVRHFLQQFPPRDTGARDPDGEPVLEHSLLRVVTRVYLTGRVNVSMYSGKAAGGTFSAGEKRPVESLNIAGDSNAISNIEALNRLLRGEPVAPASAPAGEDPPHVSPLLPPGGTVQVAMASSRSVSLEETFPRPLAIGYLGFDVSIEKDGRLGEFVSTLSRLARRPSLPTELPFDDDDCHVEALSSWLASPDAADPGARAARLRAWLDQHGLAGVDVSDFVFAALHRARRAEAAADLGVGCRQANGD